MVTEKMTTSATTTTIPKRTEMLVLLLLVGLSSLDMSMGSASYSSAFVVDALDSIGCEKTRTTNHSLNDEEEGKKYAGDYDDDDDVMAKNISSVVHEMTEEDADDNHNDAEDEEEGSGRWLEWERCKRDPMWREDDDAYPRCQTIVQWEPRDRFWRHHSYEFMDENFDTMLDCLDDQWKKAIEESPPLGEGHWTDCLYESDDNNDNPNCWIGGTSMMSLYRNVNEGDMVTMESILSEDEAHGIQSLATCIQKLYPAERPYFEIRTFGTNDDDPNFGLYEYQGGNICTFLNGFFQVFLPGVTSSIVEAIYEAWLAAGWENRLMEDGVTPYPDPRTLGIRTVEYIHYNTAERLGLHPDTESIYTISLALQDEDDYDGGYFHLELENVLFKVPRLSGIVFASEDLHGVKKDNNGNRDVFVLELWPEDDVRMGVTRPSMEDWLEQKEGFIAEEEEQQHDNNNNDDHDDDDATVELLSSTTTTITAPTMNPVSAQTTAYSSKDEL